MKYKICHVLFIFQRSHGVQNSRHEDYFQLKKIMKKNCHKKLRIGAPQEKIIGAQLHNVKIQKIVIRA